MTVSTSASELFRRECDTAWEGLLRHPFVRELAAGTLPPEKFRFYLEQNVMYLREYAQAMALGAAKSEDLAIARYFVEAFTNVVDNEIRKDGQLLERALALGAQDRGGSVAMAPANLGYTGFLVSTALRCGSAEIMAAITPCTWSYGDIPFSVEGVVDHPIYADWIRFFAKPEYQALVAEMKGRLDDLAAGLREADLRRLSDLFTTSVRLERAFWDMAYNCEQWPDIEP